MEYYKNLDLNDIVYLCEDDLVWKTEQWKDIPEYVKLYQVSDLGRVKSLSRISAHGHKLKEKILTPVLSKNSGYYGISLSKNAEKRRLHIHQLVAIAFLNHKPCGNEFVVDHKWQNRQDNRARSLRIITTRENCNQAHILRTSKYVGVHWHETKAKWVGKIIVNKKTIHLGGFDSEIECSEYYQNALKSIEKGDPIEVKWKRYNKTLVSY